MAIKNKTLVNNMKNILLKEVDEQFEHNKSNLEMVFKNNIKNAIIKTASDINFDIIHKGAFVIKKTKEQ
jgi:hypothetical protein